MQDETPQGNEQEPQGQADEVNETPKPDGFQPITSQEQLNEVIAGRVRRAEDKVREAFADYDDLKAAAAIAEAANSELTALRDAVLAQAYKSVAAMTTVDADDLPKLLDLTNVKVTATGTVEGLDEAVNALLEAKPIYRKTETPATKPGVGKQDADRKSPPPKTDITAQIAAAEAKGDWDTSNRLKAQLLVSKR